MGEIAKTEDALRIRQVFALEREIQKLEQIEIPVVHYFSKDVYAREVTIPKGAIVTGEIHKFMNLSILSKGDMTVTTADGVKRVQAPFTIVSPPGTKRAVYAHEECVWTTIHGTDETNVEKIKTEFIAESYEDFLLFCKEQSKLESE